MAAEHQHQIHNAVVAALTPSEIQSPAYDFLQAVMAGASETWTAGLGCFLAGDNMSGQGRCVFSFGGETRLFGLQVVDAALTPSSDGVWDSQAAMERSRAVKDQLTAYILREYVEGIGEEPTYIRNKVVQTLCTVFMNLYQSTWPDFFTFFSTLTQKQSTSATTTNDTTTTLNPRTADLFLRLLHEISVEISDADLRLNKPSWRLETDTKLRDAFRANDAPNVAQDILGVATTSLQSMKFGETATAPFTKRQAEECLEMSVRVVAEYVGWVDIALFMTPAWIQILFEALQSPQYSIRLAAAEALIATVSKGMPPQNRLELYGILGLGDVLTTLMSQRKGKGKAVSTDEEEGTFTERLARILNGMGVELCKVCEGESAPIEVRQTAHTMMTCLLPLLITFLEDDWWPVASAVLPFASVTLSRYKREKKAVPASHLTDEKREFLSRLLHVIILRMRFPSVEEFDWQGPPGPGEQEDDDMVEFAERRRILKTNLDAIASVDEEMFTASVGNAIATVLDSLGNGSSGLAWQEVELAGCILHLYGEAVRGSTWGLSAFVQLSTEEKRLASKKKDHKITYSDWPLSTLAELLKRCCLSDAFVSFPHPSVQLVWFETVVRYHEFFTLCPEAIPKVFSAFLDQRGLHQEKIGVRSRCIYLFFRFVSQAKSFLQSQLNVIAVERLLLSFKPLIQIERPTIPPGTNDMTALSTIASSPSFFDDQLYLFNSMGTLISMLHRDSQQQLVLLRTAVSPLVTGIQANVRSKFESVGDLESLILVERNMRAIATLAKGFPEVASGEHKPNGEWGIVFREATDSILIVTKALNQFQIIREAARSSFKKIVNTLGIDALPYVPVLIDCLVGQLTMTELVDFTSFVGQLIHKYKDQFATLLDGLLLPLLTRIFACLEPPVTGTDDSVHHSELRRAYFSLLTSIISGNMQGVFLSATNKPHLQTILNSITHYIGEPTALPVDQKAGLLVLNRLAPIWVNSQPGKSLSHTVNDSPIPGFEQFLYEKAIPVCFDIPSRAKFDWGDAQSFQVLQEIAILIRSLFKARGDEFVQFMLSTFFPSIGCPPEEGQKLLAGFETPSDAKQSRKPLVEFFGQARKSWCPPT